MYFPLIPAVLLMTPMVHGVDWTFDTTLVAPEVGLSDFFGDSLAHDGNTLVVGEPGRDRVYVYVEDDSSVFQLQQEIDRRPNYGSDQFGASVAIEDDTLVVGSPGVFRGGAAFIFHRSDNTWEEATNLTGSVQDNGDEFGAAVDIYTTRYGRLVAIGSPRVTIGATEDAGAVFEYYYNEASGTYDREVMINALHVQQNGRFGSNIVLDRDILVSSQSLSAAASQYVRVLLERLGPEDAYDNGNSRAAPIANEAFGKAIAVRHLIGELNPDLVFVGAPDANSGTGKVYVYEFVPYEGLYGVVAELTASDAEVGANFGTSLATYNDTLVVGATKTFSPGKVYVFNPDDTGMYQEHQIIVDPFDEDSSNFGETMSLNESILVVGAPTSDLNGFRGGAAHIFRREETAELGEVTGLTLVSASTNTDIAELEDGAYFDVSVIGRSLSVRADSTGSVGSVVFGLNDNSTFRFESVTPYYLGGDNNGNVFRTRELRPPSTYTVTATPYSEPGGEGTAGEPFSVTFALDTVPLGTLTGYTLIDTVNNVDIRPLSDGDEVLASDLVGVNSLSIRADYEGQIAKVVFDLDGVLGFNREVSPPYYLDGRNRFGNVKPVSELTPGAHVISATPYTRRSGRGVPGKTLTIGFTLPE